MRLHKVDKMAGQPEKRFNNGQIKATVWKNKSKAGDEFRTVSLNKSYNKNGEWKNTNSLNAKEIEQAIDVLKQAQDYLDSDNE